MQNDLKTKVFVHQFNRYREYFESFAVDESLNIVGNEFSVKDLGKV